MSKILLWLTISPLLILGAPGRYFPRQPKQLPDRLQTGKHGNKEDTDNIPIKGPQEEASLQGSNSKQQNENLRTQEFVCPMTMRSLEWADFSKSLEGYRKTEGTSKLEEPWYNMKGDILGFYTEARERYKADDKWPKLSRTLLGQVFRDMTEQEIKELCDCIYR